MLRNFWKKYCVTFWCYSWTHCGGGGGFWMHPLKLEFKIENLHIFFFLYLDSITIVHPSNLMCIENIIRIENEILQDTEIELSIPRGP